MSPTAHTPSTPRTRAVGIDWNEAVLVVGQPDHGRSVKPRQRDGQVDLERALQLQPQLAVLHLLGERARPHMDARGLEPACHRGARRRPEDPQRLGFRGDDLDSEVKAAAPTAFSGEQRQLIERKRPGRSRHSHEGDAVTTAGLQRVEGLLDGQDVARTGEGQRASQGGLRPSAQREQQRVIGNGGAVARVDLALPGPYPDHDVGDPAYASVAGDGVQAVARRRLAAERLDGRQGAIGQMPRRGDDADAKRLVRERLEREQPLQGAHPTAGDDDVHGHAVHHRGSAVPAHP
jgi:hypothetical protein